MRIFVFLLVSFPTFASALEFCDDYWLSRNMIFDRAGLCFSSALGRATFNNDDCLGGDVTLTTDEQVFVDAIEQFEEEFACNVDTTRTRLAVEDLDIRLRLTRFPLRDPTESACIGWQGGRVLLFEGFDENGRVTGSIMRGDNILSSHFEGRDLRGRVWNYYTVRREIPGPEVIVAAGWTFQEVFNPCDMIAG
ncbi:MAG: DUF4453 domain-containing protein [Pseudomonadota bacterium]